MSYRDQRFVGIVNADSIVSTNFIIGSGNFASGSNLIADVNISSGDETLIRPGQIVFSVAGAVPAGTTVQSVNADYTQITLNQQATATAASDKLVYQPLLDLTYSNPLVLQIQIMN